LCAASAAGYHSPTAGSSDCIIVETNAGDYEILRSQAEYPAKNTSGDATDLATTCRIFKAINGTISVAACQQQQHHSNNIAAATAAQQQQHGGRLQHKN